MEFLKTGSDAEKAGAVRALYWGFARTAGERVQDLQKHDKKCQEFQRIQSEHSQAQKDLDEDLKQIQQDRV